MPVDERDLTQEKRRYYEMRAKVAIRHLEARNVTAEFAPTRQDALLRLMSLIPDGATVGRGDSVTLDQIGIGDALKDRGTHQIFDPSERDEEGHLLTEIRSDGASAAKRARKELAIQAFLADIFLTGSNAVTLDGKLVNVDGDGNRVIGLIYSKKVIVVAGGNKLVADVDEALDRIRKIAAPLNTIRHCLKHWRNDRYGSLPCNILGSCTDCSNEWRICRHTVITEGSLASDKGRIHVVLVGEDLGI